jgi:hypothetical protein
LKQFGRGSDPAAEFRPFAGGASRAARAIRSW